MGAALFCLSRVLPARIGFYITYFVAARNVRSAEARAVQRLRDRWEAFYSEASGELIIEVHEIERLRQRFRFRWRQGFAFYSVDD
jgi:hypothetical protein